MRVVLAIMGACVLALVSSRPAWAIGPSFDCAKAEAPAARLICSDPNLARVDLELAQTYYALRQEVGPQGWASLKREDLNFQYNATQECSIPREGNLPPDARRNVTCLEYADREQRTIWMSRLAGAAAEEAKRLPQQNLKIQRELQSLTLLPADSKIDGVFGAETRSAMVVWQRLHDEPQTGILSDDEAQELAQQASGLPESASVAGSEPRQMQSVPDVATATQNSRTQAVPVPTASSPKDEGSGIPAWVVPAGTAYIFVAGLITLPLVRRPLISWYRSNLWIISGSSPVDILFKQIGFRISFEAFIVAVSLVLGPLGGWLVVMARRKR